MRKKIVTLSLSVMTALLPLGMRAQQNLTLEQCRKMAVENSKVLQQARTSIEMAGYDRKIAQANYLPNVSATGAYLYNPDGVSLVSDESSARIQSMGTTIHSQAQAFTQGLMGAITSNPAAAMEYMSSPMWQTVLGALSQTDLSQVINAIGAEIDDALHPDLSNVIAGGITVTQPVFMGGKIITANKIARLAEDLSRARYDQQYQETIISVDQAYWQIVSISSKLRLAQAYSDLLHKMEKDVTLAVSEGVSTQSEALQVKVKANEADVMKTKAENGLALAKMLLCKETGLDLNSEIVLADETLADIPVPQIEGAKSLEEIYNSRPETRSLTLASDIYEKKVRIARADMLPRVAAMAGYLVSNPNVKNGFQTNWGGFMSAGVIVNVPIFHGMEAAKRTRKAKAEATLYQCQLEEAKELIALQVAQLRRQESETREKIEAAKSNLECAEENLRTATVGFEEGVIDANTALAAQTAWLSARSELIDAGIELQMLASNLKKAEGSL